MAKAPKHPLAQAQTCVRIARRAECRADWLESLDPVGNADEVRRCRDKAVRATDDLVRLVRDNPDAGWSLPQRRAADTWEVER